MVELFRISKGREFQMIGAVTEKLNIYQLHYMNVINTTLLFYFFCTTILTFKRLHNLMHNYSQYET